LGAECFESDDYKEFFKSNHLWLVPYAAFSYFRDKYGNSHFDEWKTNSIYRKEEIQALIESDSPRKRKSASTVLYNFIFMFS
jgi:4-alpha-glucanotransferase